MLIDVMFLCEFKKKDLWTSLNLKTTLKAKHLLDSRVLSCPLFLFFYVDLPHQDQLAAIHGLSFFYEQLKKLSIQSRA